MINKHMKNVLTSVIGNTQIKAIIDYCRISSEVFMLKKREMPNVGEDVEQLKPSYVAGAKVKSYLFEMLFVSIY